MQEELFNSRDFSYSAWHRRLSTCRYVGIEKAQSLAMVDIDVALFVEFDHGSKQPVALIEIAMDVGQEHKSALVTMRLSQMAGIASYCVLYTCAKTRNPANPLWPDISGFRVKRLWPRPERSWRTLRPDEWAHALLRIREWAARRLDLQAANDDVY